MINQMKDFPQRRVATSAGVVFLRMTIAAMYAYGFVLGNLIVPGGCNSNSQ